jgi:hypothetical protein
LDDFDPELFVCIKIPDPLGPFERGERYEDPLETVLSQHQLGEVSGGGSQLGDEGPNGTPTIAFCGVDVSTTDRERALAILRRALVKLRAPVGTELHYTRDRIALQDVLDGDGWKVGQGRTVPHPYFGC